MTHDELKELLPLKALERLDADEERALAEHLAAGCDECERELASFREALGAMAMAAAAESGAASERIWHLIEPRLAGAQSRAAGRARDVAVRSSNRRRTATRIAAMLGAVVAIALSLTILNLERGLTDARNTTRFEVAALRARIDYLEHGLDEASARIADLRNQLSLTSSLTLAALSPDTRMVRLAGMPAAPNASATLAYNRNSHTAFMQITGLPPAPANKVYEAWWIARKTGPIRAGLFEMPSEGIAKVELVMPPEGAEPVASAVTLEPAGGTDKPTGSIYLKGEVSR
jgi:anti-sigma-K factor RskA